MAGCMPICTYMSVLQETCVSTHTCSYAFVHVPVHVWVCLKHVSMLSACLSMKSLPSKDICVEDLIMQLRDDGKDFDAIINLGEKTYQFHFGKRLT